MSFKSKRSHEGVILVHNEAPGLSMEEIAAQGLDPRKVVGAGVRAGVKYEMPTLTCRHCHAGFIVNPGRTRDRPWCSVCDHYICDLCAGLGTGCRDLERTFDTLRELAVRNTQSHLAFLRQTISEMRAA